MRKACSASRSIRISARTALSMCSTPQPARSIASYDLRPRRLVGIPSPPAPRQIIIFDNIPAANDHNGGIIQFGPDGMLYIFVGENDIRD